MAVSVVVALRNEMVSELVSHELNRRGKHFRVVARAHASKDLLERISEHKPDVAVVSPDLQDEAGGGLKVLRVLRTSHSKTRTVVLMDCAGPESVINVFAAGARGVICNSESVAALCKSILSVHAGNIWADHTQLDWIVETLSERQPIRVVNAKGASLLTKREEEIVSMVAEGLPNGEISSKLGVSPHTIKNHLFRIYEKLGISNRVELLLYALGSRER